MLNVKSLSVPVRLEAPLILKVGACVAFSGASGSGKSRFLRALADLDPNDGEMSLDGVSRNQMSAPDWRRQVTYVGAESGWWAERVRDHFVQNDLAAVRQLLDAMEMPRDALDWEVMRLSTGERQRLAIARALIQKPNVLLLDEPTAPLDEKSTANVETLLRAHLARGGVLLLVTHDPAQERRLADRTFEVVKLIVREVLHDI